MEYKDYYRILGVDRDADRAEIKRAYRKLARRHHPDVNPGDAQAQERFKEINEAYEVLSDPQKRQKYDRVGAEWRQWEHAGGDSSQFWQQWFGGRQRGGQVRVEVSDLGDLFGGGAGGSFSEFFNALFGGAQAAGFEPGRPRSSRGRDLEHPVEVSLQEAIKGTTRVLSHNGRRVEIKIPPGVDTGSRVRMRGQGEPGQGGAPAGDLYLRVRVRADPRFRRRGDDLHSTVPVELYTAVLGGEALVPTPEGQVSLKIPPETPNGKVFRLKGKGMPKLKDPKQRGHLYARVEVEIPADLSSEEEGLFRQLSHLRKEG